MARAVQIMVGTPTTGIQPIANPRESVRASWRGEIPCRSHRATDPLIALESHSVIFFYGIGSAGLRRLTRGETLVKRIKNGKWRQRILHSGDPEGCGPMYPGLQPAPEW